MKNRKIKIASKSLMQDKEAVREELRGINRNWTNVEKNVEKLCILWEGSNHTAFWQQFDQDSFAMKDIMEKLAFYAGCMGYAGLEYARCEETVMKALKEIII